MTPNSDAAILSRLLEPSMPRLSPETARFLASLDFASADRDRMNDLSAKARSGSLSPEEDEELENYIRVGDWLGIIQSRARIALKGVVAEVA